MFRGWFDDLEKAIAAFRAVVKDELFCFISVNLYGDFIFKIDEKIEYFVKRDSLGNYSVWRNFGDWRNPDWREIKNVSR